MVFLYEKVRDSHHQGLPGPFLTTGWYSNLFSFKWYLLGSDEVQVMPTLVFFRS